MNCCCRLVVLFAALLAGTDLSAENRQRQGSRSTQAKELSLDEGIALLNSGIATLEKIEGYRATFAKRERVNNKLTEYQYLDLKIRHEPFSVYTHFLGPDSLKGQEALYVEGKYQNQLIARPAGVQGALLGALQLDPQCPLAMNGNRHPITKAGMKNLLGELVQLSETRKGVENCRVFLYPQSKVDGRDCKILQISNPVKDGPLELAHARLFVDKQWNVPIRFECYHWDSDGKPLLVEEYTYMKLQLNPGLTDRDFDRNNPNYNLK